MLKHFSKWNKVRDVYIGVDSVWDTKGHLWVGEESVITAERNIILEELMSSTCLNCYTINHGLMSYKNT